jgi:hypothetical protein
VAPIRSERDAVCAPLEEARAELLLERLHPLAYCGLLDEQRALRLGEPALANDFVEVANRLELHESSIPQKTESDEKSSLDD